MTQPGHKAETYAEQIRRELAGEARLPAPKAAPAAPAYTPPVWHGLGRPLTHHGKYDGSARGEAYVAELLPSPLRLNPSAGVQPEAVTWATAMVGWCDEPGIQQLQRWLDRIADGGGRKRKQHD